MSGQPQEHVVERRARDRDVECGDAGGVEQPNRLGNRSVPPADRDAQGPPRPPTPRRPQAEPARQLQSGTAPRRRVARRATRRRRAPSARPASLPRSRGRGRSPRFGRRAGRPRRGIASSAAPSCRRRRGVRSCARGRSCCAGRARSSARRGRPPGGRATSAAARSSRRRIPPEYVRTSRPAASARSNPVEQLVRPRASPAARQVVEPADQGEVLEAGEVLVDGRVLPREADPLPQRAGVTRGVGPATRALPGRARAGSSGCGPRWSCRRRSGRAGRRRCRLDLEVHARERRPLAVALLKPVVSIATSRLVSGRYPAGLRRRSAKLMAPLPVPTRRAG